ncbi:dTDP-glucose 4,6-dehydratase, partial [Methylobacterium frigidaeris]
MTQPSLNRSQQAEAAEDAGSNPSPNPTLGEVVARRFDRREILRGGLAVAAISATLAPRAAAAAEGPPETFPFRELPAGADERHHVADGHDAEVLIRWGDPVLPGAPPF